jgi:hypothetical protein
MTLGTELIRVAFIQNFRVIQFFMAATGCITTNAPNAFDPNLLLIKQMAEVGWVGAVDHVVHRAVVGFAINGFDRSLQGFTGWQSAIGFDGKRDHDRNIDLLCGFDNADGFFDIVES